MLSSETSSAIQINQHMAPYAAAGWELVTAYAFVAPEGNIVHYFYWRK
jgi:hypothetical protein